MPFQLINNGSTVYAFKDSQWGNILMNLVKDRYVDAETAATLGIPANENPNASYPRLTLYDFLCTMIIYQGLHYMV